MDIWLDSTNIQTLQTAVRFGLLSGVTTNPTLIAKTGKNIEEVLQDILHYQEGPVAVQVVSTDTFEMVQQGQTFYSLSKRLIIKVPVSKNGLEAIHLLSRQGIPTMGTIVFHPRQAWLASLAGANYIAPYLGRMEKAGIDPWDILKKIAYLLTQSRSKTKIIGASIQTVEHVLKCAEIGIQGVTVKDELFEKLIQDDELTSNIIDQFANDWEKASSSLFTL